MNKYFRKHIPTKQLIIQPFNMDICVDFYELVQQNTAWICDNFPTLLKHTLTINDTKNYVQQRIFDWNKDKSYAYIICDVTHKKPIGYFNIKDVDWRKKQCEFSYFIDDKQKNKGLMTEAIQAIILNIFTTTTIQHIVVQINHTNLQSIKVAEKCWFKYEGTFYKPSSNGNNTLTDTAVYGITKEAFEIKRRTN